MRYIKPYKSIYEATKKVYIISVDDESSFLFFDKKLNPNLTSNLSVSSFCEQILNKEITWDLQVYSNPLSIYNEKYSNLDDYDYSYDFNLVYLLNLVEAECAKELIEIFKDNYNVTIKADKYLEADLKKLRKESSKNVYDDYMDQVEQKEWWDKFDRDIFDDLCERIGIDSREGYQLLKHNFQTNGKASRSLIDKIDSEGSDIDEEDFAQIMKAMAVAQHRHLETDYDNVSKKGLTPDQVKDLRKSYNR